MDIYRALFWVCVVLCAFAELLILRATFFPPVKEMPLNSVSNPASDLAQAANLPHSPRAIEILWGVLPLCALVAIFWSAWQTLF